METSKLFPSKCTYLHPLPLVRSIHVWLPDGVGMLTVIQSNGLDWISLIRLIFAMKHINKDTEDKEEKQDQGDQKKA